MSHPSEPCILRPDITRSEADDPLNAFFLDQERVKAVEEHRLYMMCLELTGKCYGSCSYCYASAADFVEVTIPTEKALSLIDEAWDLGVRSLILSGGEPLLHPEWFKITTYAREKGMEVNLLTSTILSRKVVKQVCTAGFETVMTNLATLNQGIYNQVHSNPKTLEKRIQGHYYLLEAGYPVERMVGQVTLTRPVVQTIEETIDWYVDEIGIRWICLMPFKVTGFGAPHREWEPSLSDVKMALLYRAKKLGDFWLRTGSSEGGKYCCSSFVAIISNGTVSPCPLLPKYSLGNIYQESLGEIFERHRDEITFNFQIKGPCGTCKNNDVCIGCRGTAYSYLGDLQASDPKCFMNPEAPEYVYAASEV